MKQLVWLACAVGTTFVMTWDVASRSGASAPDRAVSVDDVFERFVLTDPGGVHRFVFQPAENGSRLEILAVREAGENARVLSLSETGALQLYAPDGRSFAAVEQLDGRCALRLGDPAGQQVSLEARDGHAALRIGQEGRPSCSIHVDDAAGEAQLELHGPAGSLEARVGKAGDARVRIRDAARNARATMGLRADGYAFLALMDGGGAASVVNAALEMEPGGQARVVLNGANGMSAVLGAGSTSEMLLGHHEDGRQVRLAAGDDSSLLSLQGPKLDEERASMDLLFSKGSARLQVKSSPDAVFDMALTDSVHGRLQHGGAVTGEFRWPDK